MRPSSRGWFVSTDISARSIPSRLRLGGAHIRRSVVVRGEDNYPPIPLNFRFLLLLLFTRNRVPCQIPTRTPPLSLFCPPIRLCPLIPPPVGTTPVAATSPSLLAYAPSSQPAYPLSFPDQGNGPHVQCMGCAPRTPPNEEEEREEEGEP